MGPSTNRSGSTPSATRDAAGYGPLSGLRPAFRQRVSRLRFRGHTRMDRRSAAAERWRSRAMVRPAPSKPATTRCSARWLQPRRGLDRRIFALIPYPSWQRISRTPPPWLDRLAGPRRDHRRARTTAAAPWERRLVDFAWRTHLPLFSLIYRFPRAGSFRASPFTCAPRRLAPVRTGVVGDARRATWSSSSRRVP